MKLILFHPGLTRFSCGDCKRWVYDLETGQRETVCNGQVDVERGLGNPTPCSSCFKQGPQFEKLFQLTPANRKTLDLYLQNRATHGRSLSDAMVRDRWLMSNFALLGRIFDEFERSEFSKSMAQVAGLR